MGLLGRTVSCGAIAYAFAGALACNALTGADALSVDDRSGAVPNSNGNSGRERSDDATLDASSSGALGGTASSSSSSSTSSSSSSSGEPGEPGEPGKPSDPSTPAPPAGAIIHETFASAGACTGVSVTNGATKTFDESGRTGGACKLCATAAGGMFAELSGTATQPGQATFEAYARRVPGAATPANANIELRVGGASISSSNGLGDAWGRLGGGSISVQPGSTVMVRVGLADAATGDCLLLDDVSVAVPSP